MENDLLERLSGLKRHPRVLITPAEIERIRTLVKTDPIAQTLLAQVQRRAEEYLVEPLPERIMEGRRLLGVSRSVLNGVFALSEAFVITGDGRYSRRAIDMMLAAARFSDWNPSHFLDVGEMALALGIGYDWLYDVMTPPERQAVEDALIEKGLNEGAKVVGGWTTLANNWNPVCHAGLSSAALAIAHRDLKLAAFTISRAIENVPRVRTAYEPDGAYDEGAMYWGYGTTFLVLLMAGLQTALGSTFGLENMPGLIGSARYMKHVIGPTGLTFNYSDNRESASPQAAQLWFAEMCNDPQLANSDLKSQAGKGVATGPIEGPGRMGEQDRLLALFLLWYRPSATVTDTVTAPLTWHGDGRTPVALMRTAWSPGATFLGIKGGSPGVSHAHMDVGSYVLDAGGVRWIRDLGMQEYHSLEAAGVQMWDGKQGGQRWSVFRIGTDSHSILRFGNAEQRVDASASLQFTTPAGVVGRAVVDLAPVYAPAARTATRTAELRADGQAVIEDRWETAGNAQAVVSQLITDSNVSIAGRRITLSRDGKRMTIAVDSLADVAIDVDDISKGPHATDAANPNASRIRITPKLGAGEQYIRLTFTLNS